MDVKTRKEKEEERIRKRETNSLIQNLYILKINN